MPTDSQSTPEKQEEHLPHQEHPPELYERRKLLQLLGAGIGAALTYKFIAKPAAKAAFESFKEFSVTATLNDGVNEDWDNLAVHPGLLVVSPGAEFTSEIFDADESWVWEYSYLLAMRPIMVKDTLKHNMNANGTDDFDRHAIRTELDRISENLMAIWLPGTDEDGYAKNDGKLVFFDPTKDKRHITPLERKLHSIFNENGNFVSESTDIKRNTADGVVTPFIPQAYRAFLPSQAATERYNAAVAMVTVDGKVDYSDPTFREAYDNYFYSPDSFKPTIQYKTIGRCVTASTAREIDMVTNAYQSDPHYEPLTLPNHK